MGNTVPPMDEPTDGMLTASPRRCLNQCETMLTVGPKIIPQENWTLLVSQLPELTTG